MEDEVIVRKMPCLKSIVFMAILFSLSSCAYFSKRNVIGQKKDSSIVTTVSKKQYDELLAKYQALLRRNRQLEGQELNLPSSKMKKSPNLPKLAETVDVFAEQLAKKEIIKKQPESSPVLIDNLDGQIALLKKAMIAIASSHFNRALELLKSLENSKHKQIQVRVKFYMGEILFRQQEYDLAMQLFEEVLHKYAFSGLVVKTLGRLIVCSDKLKIRKKYDLYYSILHDFFKAA